MSQESAVDLPLPWVPDLVIPGYQMLPLDLTSDSEGPVVATLIRKVHPVVERDRARWHWATFRNSTTPAAPTRVILSLHGWADYFFHPHVAGFFENAGFRFYALDLRKFGRSLLEGQSPGLIEDLATYDEDLKAAFDAIRAEHGSEAQITLMAHSLGGLIASLWANRHPEKVNALVLNAPWLEMQGSSLVRTVASHLVEPLVRRDPGYALPLPSFPAYWESVSDQGHGEWSLNPPWRPRGSFPIRVGWLRAVMDGHATVSKGLGITAPILLMLSSRTRILSEYSAEASRVDTVIDVEQVASRGLGLGRRVTFHRYEGALHDVWLSAGPIRNLALSETLSWVQQNAV